MVIIYSTFKNTEEAVKIGKIILDKKLAACVNIWPMQSMCYWEGKLENRIEGAMFIKTLEHHVAEVEEEIKKNHSHTTPYIGAIEVHRFSRPYREWMTSVIKQ